MRRILRNDRGQIILALAIVMSIVILSVSFSVYQMNAGRRLLKYEPAKEVVLAVTSDFERALAVALRDASMEFDETYDGNNATSMGKNVLRKWMRSAVTAYSHLGAEMEIMESSFKFNWNISRGISFAYSDFSMDVEAYGFRGWVGRSEKSVTLEIVNVRKTGANSATLNFSIRDNGKPVPNLTLNLLKVFVWDESLSTWAEAESIHMEYLGGGNYALSFSPIDEDKLGVKLRAITPRDRIIVSAYYVEGREMVDWGTLYVSVGENPNEEQLLPYSLLSFKTRQTTWVIHRNKHYQREISSPQIPENVYIDMRETKYVNISLYLQPSGNIRKGYIINIDLFFFDSSSRVNKTIIPTQTLTFSRQGPYTISVNDHCGGIIPPGSIVYIRITLIQGNTLHVILNERDVLYSYLELGKAYKKIYR